MKFKVGDKVAFKEVEKPIALDYGFNTVSSYEVLSVSKKFGTIMIANEKDESASFNVERFFLIERAATKKERIEALEKKVAEMNLIIHGLRKALSIAMDEVQK